MVHGSEQVHSWKTYTKPMGAVAKKSLNRRGTIRGPLLQVNVIYIKTKSFLFQNNSDHHPVPVAADADP